MDYANLKTKIKNTPVMLKIASFMYIIPALVLYTVALWLLYKNEHDYTNEYSYIIGCALFNILIGIGLYMRDIISYWIAIILPYIIIGLGIFMSTTIKDSYLPIINLIATIVVFIIGLYFGQVQYLITRPKIKILFKKDVFKDVDINESLSSSDL